MLTPELIKPLLTMPDRHAFYTSSVEKAEDLAVHAERKTYPEKLLDLARPNEEPAFRQYRRDVYEAQTFKAFGKITNLFAKIEKSEDYSVTFPESPSIIAKDEVLQVYTEKYFPFYDNIATWFWQYALPMKLRDPNMVIAVLPLPRTEATDRDYVRPFPFIFRSEQVYYYQENALAVLLDEETISMSGGGEGRIFHVLDRDSYGLCRETSKDNFTIEVTPFPYGYMPAFKPGTYAVDAFSKTDKLYDSELAVCLPDFNEAERRYSDHQVNMVRHIHPKEWRIATAECPTCKGGGKLKRASNRGKLLEYDCEKCSGSGKVSYESPFGRILIPPAVKTGMQDATNIPTPPGGYISTPIESIEAIKKEVEDRLYEAYAALNMEFLAKVPLAQSGIAKAWDRSETDNLLYNFARHFIRQLIQPTYEFIAAWRYGFLGVDQIDKLLPTIRIPRKFDVVGSSILLEKSKIAKEAGVSPIITRNMELNYAAKEFGEDTVAYKTTKSTILLDPLPNTTNEEKSLLVSAGLCSEEDAILSTNITFLVQRAIEENPLFLEEDLIKQREILLVYVEKIKPSSTLEIGIIGEDGLNSPVDVQAESQARLKGTVGGVQGIIQIQQSVSQGITDYEAAVAMMIQIYGFDEATARKLLGTPRKIDNVPPV